MEPLPIVFTFIYSIKYFTGQSQHSCQTRSSGIIAGKMYTLQVAYEVQSLAPVMVSPIVILGTEPGVVPEHHWVWLDKQKPKV